ncbi:DnaD domain protein [Lactococcus nasutitermitis]|uniref:DnaD domain protein n=1 Tax=Lactococcus nasutitermitis TaxID=1652957 RepID=A0ABV9JBS6_9LACT|nr:DnaD domain protein [Lactococcus nasutitermitis]
MRARDTFTIVNRGKTSFDAEVFTLLYLPIVGHEAFALYQLLRVFSSGKISHFLEYLNMGLNPFIEALDKLSALDLLAVYDNHPDLFFELKSPLSFDDFMADDFYKQLLISRIGESRVVALAGYQKPQGQNISRKFHEVYKLKFDEVFDSSVKKETFNMEAFKALMARQKLTFSDENQESLMIYSLAEKFELNWYELFKVVETTANADLTINLTATTRQLSGQAEPIPALSVFPKAFQDLIVVSKSVKPAEFLIKIKQEVGGFASNDEKKLLTVLSKQNLTDEVQNILIHYVLVQQKNPTLTSNFVNTVANDWLRHKVVTAEAAVTRILERNQKVQEKAITKPKAAAKLVKKAPEWSSANYVENTSEEAQAKFAELQKKMRENGSK